MWNWVPLLLQNLVCTPGRFCSVYCWSLHFKLWTSSNWYMRYMQVFDWAFFITLLTEGILVPLSLVLKYKLIVSSLFATTEFPILAQKPHLQDFKHFFQYLINSWYLLLYAFTYFQCISRHFSCFMHCRPFLLDSSLTTTQISIHSSLSNPLHLFFSTHHLITRNIADLYLVGLMILFIFFSLICHVVRRHFV